MPVRKCYQSCPECMGQWFYGHNPDDTPKAKKKWVHACSHDPEHTGKGERWEKLD